MVRLGVVGGSSLVSFDPTDEFKVIGLEIVDDSRFVAKTEYGDVNLRKFELAGGGVKHTLIFMQRHSHSDGKKGITPPHKINHKANMRALFDQKVDGVVATNSCGTILKSFPPGMVGVATQYIDFTGTPCTYYDTDAKFTSVTKPFDAKLNAALLKTLRAVQKIPESTKLEMTLWLSQGPHYETEAEVNAIERLGGECCGMTAPREAKLCAELDLPYAALTIASNWAAGRTPGDAAAALCHEEVAEMSKTTTGTIVACLIDLLKHGASS